MKKLFLVVLTAVVVRGDGVAVPLKDASGPFLVTIFTAPDPLRAGPVDVNVLVQARTTGAALVDSTLTFEIQDGPDGLRSAKPGRSKNGLVQSATLDLRPGLWRLRVSVSEGGETGEVATDLHVVAAGPRLGTVWPLLSIPPAAIALFILHQTLARRRHQLVI
jgi:hypothetical protein